MINSANRRTLDNSGDACHTICIQDTQMTMTLQDFLAQCDDATLDYIEESLLPQLIHIDKLNKLKHGCAELRQQIAEATK